MEKININLKDINLDSISEQIRKTSNTIDDIDYEVDQLKERLEIISEIEDFIYSISNGEYDINEEGQKIATELWRKY